MIERKTKSRIRLIEVRAQAEWYAKVATEAQRLGLPVSTFIRVAVNDWLDRKMVERSALPREIEDRASSDIAFVKSVPPEQQPGVAHRPSEREKATKLNKATTEGLERKRD